MFFRGVPIVVTVVLSLAIITTTTDVKDPATNAPQIQHEHNTTLLRDHRAQALVAALEIYDGSIRSVEWNVILHQTLVDGTWIRSNIRRNAIGEYGDWYTRAEYPYWEAQDSDSGVLRVWRFQRANDERMFAVDTNVIDGKVGYNDNDMLAVASPFHFIGRYCDFERHSRLHEVFARASSVRYSEPTADEPWPMISAVVPLFGTDVRFEVRVDAEHGYAPRIIRTIRDDIGVPIESLETIAYTRIDDAWVPQLGLRCLYSITSTQHDKNAWGTVHNAVSYRERSRELAGVAQGISAPDLTALRSALERHQIYRVLESDPSLFFAPLGATSASGSYSPELMMTKIYSFNKEIPEYQFFLPIPPSRTIYDFYRDNRLPFEQTLLMPRLVPPPVDPAQPAGLRSDLPKASP